MRKLKSLVITIVIAAAVIFSLTSLLSNHPSKTNLESHQRFIAEVDGGPTLYPPPFFSAPSQEYRL